MYQEDVIELLDFPELKRMTKRLNDWFPTLFTTLLSKSQNPVLDLHYDKFPTSNQLDYCKQT